MNRKINITGIPFTLEYKKSEDEYFDWWLMYEDGSERHASEEEIMLMETLEEIYSKIEKPYLTGVVTRTILKYNPKFGDERVCICGHKYYRHFDSYENMSPVGCKYCGCNEFVEAHNVKLTGLALEKGDQHGNTADSAEIR
jgi:adenine-specific DNA methylase